MKRTTVAWIGLVSLVACIAPRQVKGDILPFLSPSVTQGQIDVRLKPTESVPTNTPTLVTFGVPFPRGSINVAGLTTVTVKHNGAEIPAHVEQLTPWRHRSNAVIDGASVRVAEIQINYSFANAFPAEETIQVSWGGAARTLNIVTGQDPHNAWHAVANGEYLPGDGVSEPDVYAMLPPTWLSQGALTSVRTTVFDPSNGETRDDPHVIAAIQHWPDFQESERAFKNNFYTELNQDDPAVQDYLTGTAPDGNPAPEINLVHYRDADTSGNQAWNQREPWLYDRAATMYVLYIRSGFFTALREAVRAAEYYAQHVGATGAVDQDNNDLGGFLAIADETGIVPPFDTKYSYAESPAYTYWLTGDAAMLDVIDRVATAHDYFNHVWSQSLNFWTERHAAFKLLAKVVAWEVRGGTARRDEVEQILADYRFHQDGAGDPILLPANRVDGGLYHTGDQHSCDFPCSSIGASSWMSALLVNAATRAYASGEDAATAQFVARLGNFLRNALIVTNNHPCDDPVAQYPLPHAVPRYTVLIDGSTGDNEFEDIEHSLDVGSQLAWTSYFSVLGGGDGVLLAQSSRDLYDSYDACVNYWIRPDAPADYGKAAYRVSPPRKWSWEHRTSGGFAIALTATDKIFANGFEP